MPKTRTTSLRLPIICRPGHSVKARIVAAGIRLGALANLAGVPKSALPDELAGRRCNIHNQIKIARAFRKLSGQRITSAEFWGDLWAEKALDEKEVG